MKYKYSWNVNSKASFFLQQLCTRKSLTDLLGTAPLVPIGSKSTVPSLCLDGETTQPGGGRVVGVVVSIKERISVLMCVLQLTGQWSGGGGGSQRGCRVNLPRVEEFTHCPETQYFVFCFTQSDFNMIKSGHADPNRNTQSEKTDERPYDLFKTRTSWRHLQNATLQQWFRSSNL